MPMISGEGVDIEFIAVSFSDGLVVESSHAELHS